MSSRKVKVNQLNPPQPSLSLRWRIVYVLAFLKEDMKYDKFYPDPCTPFVMLKVLTVLNKQNCFFGIC
jgi:hypothetical protein